MAWKPDYVSVEQLRNFVRIGDTDDDTQLSYAIAAASRAIDRLCNRQFGIVDAPEERQYTAYWDRRRCRWVVETDDLMTTTGLTFTVSAGTITDYRLEPVNAPQKGRPWERLVVLPSSSVEPSTDEFGASIEALWGWSDVPLPIQQGTLLQASRFFTRRNSPFGIAGSPELGSEMRLLAKVDPDVAVSVGPYKRWWAAA